MDCTSGHVCAKSEVSYEVLGRGKGSGWFSFCWAKTDQAGICTAVKAQLATQGTISNWNCGVEFCETALCNSGFTAHVSFLVLAAGVLVFGLF